MNWHDDPAYYESIITSIEGPYDDASWCKWAVTSEEGTIGIEAYGGDPKLGDTIRYYGKGFGRPVRGIAVGGVLVRYETHEQMRDRAEREAKERDCQKHADAKANWPQLKEKYDNLPPVFQRRIDRFCSHNPDFWWDFEPYEMVCCVDAVKIAAYAKTTEGLAEFHALNWDDQISAIPDLDQAHSGNTFGMACRLAYHYIERPELVQWEHGALANLVGCDEYGCPPLTTDELTAAGASLDLLTA